MEENKRKTFSELIQESDVPVLVDVYSDTCGPCIALKPVLKELKNNMGEGLRIVKINGPHNMHFMDQWQIQAFPTLMLFHKGEMVWREMGYRPLNQLEQMVRGSIPAEA